MKARYDLLNFESQIVHSKLWQQSFELLKKSGVVRFESEGKNAGCWVILAQGEEDKVVVRSDGTATYIAKDIPYAAWKLGLVKDPFCYFEFAKQWDGSVLYATSLNGGTIADSSNSSSSSKESQFSGGYKAITIIDSRQARLQRIIAQVLEQMGGSGADANDRYVHLAYEAVTLSAETAKSLGLDIGQRQSVHMSGRKGLYVNADYVLDTLHNKAYEEVKSRNPDFDDGALHRIAEEIAVSAIRYTLAKQDLDKAITFDIKESLSLEGDTGPYLQYAYARSQRILEKSSVQQVGANISYDSLTLEPETTLVKEMSKLDMVVEDAAKSMTTKSIARYSYSLATAFNLFYEKVPVLKEENKETLAARLALVKAFGITLRNSLRLLGISALERM
jgi:arginyl-tRNA synthetase